MSEPKWLQIARKHVGVKEVAGAGNNPKIVAFSKRATGTGQPDSVPWCAAFVGSCLEEAGIRSTRALNARSYLKWGKPVTKPRVGDIVVFWRGKKDGWQGHVAFFLGISNGRIKVLGGNQSDKVSITTYSAKQLLGYRAPVVGTETAPLPNPPAEPKIEQPRGYSADVEALQVRLKRLGYSQVGMIDGRWGNLTRGALLAFKGDWNADHPDMSLPMDDSWDTAAVDKALRAAAPRHISEERRNATLGDLRDEGSRTIAATDAIKGVGGVVAVGGAVGGAVDTLTEVSETAQTVNEALGPIQSLLAVVGDYWWLLAIGLGGVALYFAVKAARARLDDHRNARTV